MKTSELRQKYLEFFKSKGHEIIPSASLIPENDATVLFTTAGMHPLVPYLMGEKHAQGTRLVDFQKCIRTGDIDEVGNQWHLTFFEMLGNWSLGDYWKKETINFSYDFLVKELGIDPNKLAVTVFEGDNDAPFDEESYNAWLSVGIPEGRIYKYDKTENWWGLASGPCGPDSEMFYISDKEPCGADCQPSCSCGKYVEIWNDVFMEYDHDGKGNYKPLKQKNVDTGMGLERVLAVLNNKDDNYQADHIWPLVEVLEDLSGKKYADNKKAFRVVVDHCRAATFILGDEKGIQPSNVDQGYILRRLIRRAVRFGKQLGVEEVFTFKIAEVVIKQMSDVYPELKNNKDFIVNQLVLEEEKFAHTLENGLRQLGKLQESKKEKKQESKITGEEAFDLFSTYGFPLEMTKELADEQGLAVDESEFEKEFIKHQELSRAGADQKFKGGLADQGESTTKLHTATHLLQAALQKVLGEHVKQKGSNITPERLRFDFTHDEKMTDEQKKQVEDLINDWIKKDLKITCEEIPYMDAKERGVIGLFEDKYGDVVKVFSIGDVSSEMCGGPHVEQTGALGHFKIKKEESSSAGIRRIKAILE